MISFNRLIRALKRIPFLGRLLNRYATNKVCKVTSPRPRPFSLWSHIEKSAGIDEHAPVGEYTAWPMLTDKEYSNRHLPPATRSYVDELPDDTPPTSDGEGRQFGDITRLFERQGNMLESRSSMLFMFFAQWFTDSVLRVDPGDRRKNTSNHNIDLCQIYGLNEDVARLLRDRDGGKGYLKSQLINDEEFPDYLGEVDENGKWNVKDEYKKIPYTEPTKLEAIYADWPEERKRHLYATGLERGNSSVGYVAISTLFLREHNRICRQLGKLNPGWDDERLFQTARMINNVILMKLIVQDYINHIAGIQIFEFDPSFAEQKDWYRAPWISIEFDLLYRWHGLVPDTIRIDNRDYDHRRYRVNNVLLEQAGLRNVIESAASQAAGAIRLNNTPTFLLNAEFASLRMGRDFRLCSFNDYRRRFGLKPIRSFHELNPNAHLCERLKSLYGDIDNVEFVVGLFAEQAAGQDLYGKLMYTMVACDAFTQIYTNPLLSKNVYHEGTLTQYGLELIDATNSIQDLTARNIAEDITAKFGV